MRRLCQLGTLLLLLATFLTPISEYFDRWDTPGLGNDTEFGVFALVFALALVLFLCSLIAALALRLTLDCAWASPAAERGRLALTGASPRIPISPHLSAPLRI